MGGLLFVMEEVASHWDLALTRMVFFSTASAFLTVALVSSQLHAWRAVGTPFGVFTDRAQVLFQPELVLATVNISILIVAPSVLLGLLQGALAVVFTRINLKVSAWRARRVAPRPWRRVAESAAVAA
eukprot:gene10180-21233_t